MEDYGYIGLMTETEETDKNTFFEEKKEEKMVDRTSVDYIVLAVNNPAFKISKPTYNLIIYGKSMIDMVKNVCETNPRVREVSPRHNVLDEVKPLLGDADITVVLYSDSPLITKNTINDAVNHLIDNGLNVVKLTHGYIFKTEYVRHAFDIFSTETFYSNEEDFLVATNFKQLALIAEIQKNRILSFHMKNGVEIRDPNSTYIDQDVIFGKNVLIYPNNVIYGKMEVGDDVIFYSDNLVGDCVVKNGSKILMSKIKKSVILEDVKVFGSTVEGSLLEKNVDIRYDSKITNSMIKEGASSIGATTFNAVIGRSCVLNTNSSVISYKDERAVLKDNVIIGTGAVVQGGIVVGENSTILPASVVTNSVPANMIYGERRQIEMKPKE